MFDVKRVYMYCMGDSVLDKRKFSEDTANARFANRVQLDQTAHDVRQMLNPKDQFRPAQPQLTGFAAILQNAVRLIFKPVAMTLQFFQALPQMLAQPAALFQKAANLAEKAISQILTFFFGYKKDKTEEKEKRDKNDFATLDLFSERKVEESNQSQLGGGQ